MVLPTVQPPHTRLRPPGPPGFPAGGSKAKTERLEVNSRDGVGNIGHMQTCPSLVWLGDAGRPGVSRWRPLLGRTPVCAAVAVGCGLVEPPDPPAPAEGFHKAQSSQESCFCRRPAGLGHTVWKTITVATLAPRHRPSALPLLQVEGSESDQPPSCLQGNSSVCYCYYFCPT